ncbi:MAG: O-antigen ligase family protein, partial [Lactobacillus delbrueckii]
ACRTFYLTSLLIASALLLGASYMSGNVLDFPTSNLLLAFLDGGLLAYIKEEKGRSTGLRIVRFEKK